MMTRISGLAMVLAAVAGCGDDDVPEAVAVPTSNFEESIADRTGQDVRTEVEVDDRLEIVRLDLDGEDLAGPSDSPDPDGEPDAVIEVVLQGSISDIIFTVCGDGFAHTNSQWDTVLGVNEFPAGYFDQQVLTWGLVLTGEDGERLSEVDGELEEFDADGTYLIHVAPASASPIFAAGAQVCLGVVRPDGSLSLAGATLTPG